MVQAAGTQLTTATFNPLGDRLLYLSNENGRPELYARDMAGTSGRERLSSEGAVDSTWSQNGREVFFRSPGGSFFVLDVKGSGRDVKFGQPFRLFSAPLPFSFTGRTFVVLPNGTFLMKTLADDVAARSSTVVLNWTAALKK